MGIEETNIQWITKATHGLSIPSLTTIVCTRRTALGEDPPEVRYYLDEENPFAAKYTREKDVWGKEAWLTYLKGTSAFSGIHCIKDLVRHIATKLRDFYNGTKYKEDCFFTTTR